MAIVILARTVEAAIAAADAANLNPSPSRVGTWFDGSGRPVVFARIGHCLAGYPASRPVYVVEGWTERPDARDLLMQLRARGLTLLDITPR